MDNQIELPHNQLILNAGEHHTGIIFAPFGDEVPSDYSAPRHAPISSSGSGWIARPDAGGTVLSKDAAAPIGDPNILALFALIYMGVKKCFCLLIVLFFSTMQIGAQVSELSISKAVSGEGVTINPTITSVPYANASICWGLYYDSSCDNSVDGIGFYGAPSTGVNAVGFIAPANAGTYFLKTSIQAAYVCGGLVDSEVITPIVIYPADADIVLLRDAQSTAVQVDVTDRVSKAYGVMRFRKTVLNNAAVSAFERYNYFISFPFDVKIGDIYGIGTVGTDWRILYYDGLGRAQEGFFAERTDNWGMFDDTDDVLQAGEGYLLQLNTESMAEENTAIWRNGADIVSLFFPALSTISEMETENVTIPALGSDYACTIDLSASLGDEADRRVKDSYWRCIGVPSFSSPSGVTNLDYFYQWNMADNSLTVKSSDKFTFLPTHAYLVQNGASFTWLNALRPASIVARQKDAQMQEWQLEIWQGDTEHDRAFVRLTDEADVTNNFDFGHDLSKELNPGKANIYTLVGYERLAANVLPETVQNIPVGIQIAQSGEYRITLNKGAWLVDSQTGVRSQDYTVFLNAGTYEGRFSIAIGDAIPTGFDPQERTSENIRKVLFHGILYIEKDGKKYIIL